MNLDDLILRANPKVHIRNPKYVHQTLEKFKGNSASLQVITDFDRTLTKHSSNGLLCPSSHAVLEGSGLFSTKYTKETSALRAKYYPLEMDINIGPEEKEKLMIEWWSEAHRLLLDESLKKKDVQVAVKNCTVEFRRWCDHLLAVLRLSDVPVLVFSAGIGTVVREVFLQKSLFRLENIEIISNFLHFNAEGVHVGFEGPMIHTFNKGKMGHLNKEYFEKTSERINVVLLGDTLGDLEMGNNLDRDKFNMIKIGFLNDKVDQNRDVYMSKYDIVIEDPEDMNYVFQLFCAILEVELTTVEQSMQSQRDSVVDSYQPLPTRVYSCPPGDDYISSSSSLKSQELSDVTDNTPYQ